MADPFASSSDLKRLDATLDAWEKNPTPATDPRSEPDPYPWFDLGEYQKMVRRFK